MPITTHTVSAGGQQWTFTTLPASAGLEVFTQLTSILGAATGQLSSQLQPGMSLAEMDVGPGALGAALGAVGEKLADPGTIKMIRTLLGSLQKGAPPALVQIQFDLEFAGNYGVLMALVKEALQENFESFFDGSPGFGAFIQRLGVQSPKP